MHDFAEISPLLRKIYFPAPLLRGGVGPAAPAPARFFAACSRQFCGPACLSARRLFGAGLFSENPASAAEVYFTAVNNTLLALEDGEQQYQAALKIISNKWSVREVERFVKSMGKTPAKREADPEKERMDLFYRDLEERLKSLMGTKVSINQKDKNKGRIEIEYYSSAELERIIEMLQSVKN